MPVWVIGLFAGAIGKYLTVLFSALKKRELEILMPIVAQIVLDVDRDPTILTSADRFQAVISRAMAVFASKQMGVAYYMVMLAASLAVTNLVSAQEDTLSMDVRSRGTLRSRWG
jgi:hypothetical protein